MGTWPCPKPVWKAAAGSCKNPWSGPFFHKAKFTTLKKRHRLSLVPNSRKIKLYDSFPCLGEMTDSKRAFSFLYPKKVCQRYKYLKTGARRRELAFTVLPWQVFIHPLDIIWLRVMEWQVWVAHPNFWHPAGKKMTVNSFLSPETDLAPGCECQAEQSYESLCVCAPLLLVLYFYLLPRSPSWFLPSSTTHSPWHGVCQFIFVSYFLLTLLSSHWTSQGQVCKCGQPSFLCFLCVAILQTVVPGDNLIWILCFIQRSRY